MMFDKLNNLKIKGYEPDLIFDLGAHHGNWTRSMASIYPHSNYFLVESIDYPELNSLKSCRNIQIFNQLLNDEEKEVDWYEMKNTGDSMFREKGKHFVNCKIIKKKSIPLNLLLLNNEIVSNSKNIFLKIDCQGAEIPILKGSTDILDRTDFILLELPFFGQYNDNVPNFLEHIRFMDTIGFVPYDIVDNHYINGFNMQLDMLFIHKNHEFNRIVQEKLNY